MLVLVLVLEEEEVRKKFKGVLLVHEIVKEADEQGKRLIFREIAAKSKKAGFDGNFGCKKVFCCEDI